jgi:NAD(P)-dependent dehydrogenase (short-subunit alcohol dehydrogenase family)
MTRAERLALGIAAGGGLWLVWRAYRKRTEYLLRGKTVLITGGSRGLGLILAKHFLNEGAQVVLCARDPDELERARVRLATLRGHVLTVLCDVTDPAQVETLIDTVYDHYGQIDVLVNNAGIISAGPFQTMTLDDFHEAMRANFFGALHCIHAVLPAMRRRGEGRIVNITSIGGKVSVPHLLPYCASKFALVGLSEGLRAELARAGITVTTVCPGLMRTGSPRQGIFKGNARAEYTWFALSDAVPPFAMSADRAARQIVTACKRGTAEIVLSLPAKAAALFHGVFPGLTADLLGLANRLLPASEDQGGRSGKAIEATDAPTVPITLTDRAARRNNEIAPGERRGSAEPVLPGERTQPG